MSIETLAAHRCFGGVQTYHRHASTETGTEMRFSAFVPPVRQGQKVPVVFWLSGLTCTEENFTVKAGAQRVAAELGLMVIAPDTSPRGPGAEGEPVPDDPDGAYDFGLGAGFYVDATEAPWDRHYRMYSYCAKELPNVVAGHFREADIMRTGVMGHSMGGHGALVVGLRNPEIFRSVSALAPIAAPMSCPWGEKAFSRYLGPDRNAWRAYDSVALLEDGFHAAELLVDQGDADPHLAGQLKPERLEAACARANVPLTLRRQAGYDHSYFFIASFIEDHLRWHRERLF